MIVALLNQQGEVGKTTLALHLAGVWACQGRRVAIIDADPDACAVEWSELRAQETLPSRFTVTAIARDTLHRELPTVVRDVDRAIVDGPSHIEAITRSALMAADFVLVPVQPPPFRGLAFVETLRLANGMMTVRPQLRIRLVLNRCNARASVTRDLTQALAEYDPPALTSSITERAVFAEAMESGRLAFDLPHSRAAVQEITALAAEVERIVS
jgi:chromosome partitioning protein